MFGTGQAGVRMEPVKQLHGQEARGDLPLDRHADEAFRESVEIAYRRDRLLAALTPASGWRSRCRSR
jgi:hypothetical protein